MADLATIWTPGASAGDWQVFGPDLLAADDLASAVLISLFTDARAGDDDVIPDASGDRRGWWGDAGRTRALGSKLWLLERAKETEATRLAAEDYAAEALAWLTEDGLAGSVAVAASWIAAKTLGLQISIYEPTGALRRTFNYQWAWKDVA